MDRGRWDGRAEQLVGHIVRMLRVVYVLVFSRSVELQGVPRLSLLLFFFLSSRDTLDKCKECIVKTSRIVDPRQKPVRATSPFPLLFSPISRRNCSIVARDASDKLERCAR